jgi:hypothetical protein
MGVGRVLSASQRRPRRRRRLAEGERVRDRADLRKLGHGQMLGAFAMDGVPGLARPPSAAPACLMYGYIRRARAPLSRRRRQRGAFSPRLPCANSTAYPSGSKAVIARSHGSSWGGW